MGYSTTYRLTWENKNTSDTIEDTIVTSIKEKMGLNDLISEYIENHNDMNYAIDGLGEPNESCKWYDHEDDMIKMSRSIKNVLFTLTGNGEAGGDLWKKYFYNGNMQKAETIIIYSQPESDQLGLNIIL